jgi:hypothetical protein
MIMIVTLESEISDTNVTIWGENIPLGIRLEDIETGTQYSMEKLARYIEEEIFRPK